MRSAVLAMQSLASHRLSKTVPKHLATVVSGSGILGTGIWGDVVGELSKLETEVDSEEKQLFSQTGRSLEDPLTKFYREVWEPFFLEFKRFADKLDSSAHRMALMFSPWIQTKDWDEIQEYRGRLVKIDKAARDAGFNIAGPLPTAPKVSTVETVGDKVWNVGADAIDLIKKLVIVAVIILGGYFLLMMGTAR